MNLAGVVSAEPRSDRLDYKALRKKGFFFAQNLCIKYIYYSRKIVMFTTNLTKRLASHNENKSTYTKNKGPWELVYLESFENKSDAFKREKMLKKQNREDLERLIQSETNELSGGRLSSADSKSNYN